MKSVYKFFIVFLWSFFMVACSGGGDIADPLDPDPTPDEETISIVLAISDTNINAATPAVVTATVSNSKTGVMKDTLVTFTLSDDALGAFNPAIGTALTNADGQAQIELATSNIEGAGSVSATVDGFDGISPTVGFKMAGDGGGTETGNKLDVILTDTLGTTINTISATTPGHIEVTYTNAVNEPLVNQVVSFTSTLGLFSPESGTSLTDADGVAEMIITAGDVDGAATITITAGDIEQSIGFKTLGDQFPKPIDDYSVSLTVQNSAGTELRQISQSSPGTVIATLLKNGIPVSYQTVNFSLEGQGNLNPSSGTALTSTSGEAVVNLITGSVAGAGTVTTTFSLDGEQITDSFSYNVVGDAPGGDGEANQITIALTDSQTGLATTSISSANPGRVTIVLTDKDNAPLEGKVVSFASTLGSFLPTQGTALTDKLGKASILISAGSIEGAGEITANFGSTVTLIGFVTLGDEIDPVEASPEISFEIYDCNGVDSWDKALKNFDVCKITDNITNDKPGIIGATVTRSGSTQVLQQILVSAATTLGAISPNSGTAITNSEGKAVLDLYANGDVGAGEVSLKVKDVTSTKAFEIGRVDISLTITTEIGAGNLPAGGSTIVEVTVFNPDGSLSTGQPFQLEFASECSAAGKAVLDSPVVTNAGKGYSTYRSTGCEGQDTITVTAITGGSAVTASTSVTIDTVSIGAIQFLSAEPKLLALRGTGGIAGVGARSETSVVSFKLLDETNQAAPNEKVCFELSTEAGGMVLTPAPVAQDFLDCSNMPVLGDTEYPADISLPNRYAVAYTNALGEVSVTVHAGDVPSSVKVFALWSGSNGSGHNGVISNTSDQLSVTTGIADNNSFSLAPTIHNPEGWDYDNQIVEVHILAADHFNNLVPAGTTVTFVTEGGGIDGSCQTGSKADLNDPEVLIPNGACSVEWRSQDTRPFKGTGVVCPNGGFEGSTTPPCHGSTLTGYTNGANSIIAEPRPGRATITAYAIGEESFVDLNGNGLFDSGEVFTDLSEAFFDHNEDNRYRDRPRFVTDPALGAVPAGAINEEYFDYNANGVFDEGDAKYTGLLCAKGSESDCTDTGTGNNRSELNVFRNTTMVMSGSVPYIRLVNIDGSGNITPISSIDLTVTAPQTVYLFVSDLNNNTLPFETEINADTDNGDLSGLDSYTIGSNSSAMPFLYAFTVGNESSPNKKTSGTLTITVKTPLGNAVSVSLTVIDAG